jgi:hypothetical protein
LDIILRPSASLSRRSGGALSAYWSSVARIMARGANGMRPG